MLGSPAHTCNCGESVETRWLARFAAQWRECSARLRNSFVLPFLSGNDSTSAHSRREAQVRVFFALRRLETTFANLTDVLSGVEARCLPSSAGVNAEPRERADHYLGNDSGNDFGNTEHCLSG